MKELEFYTFGIFSPYQNDISHAVFTKKTPLSGDGKLQNILATHSPIIQFKNQLHGIEHLFVERDEYHDGDILITQKQHSPLLIRTADCVSLIIFDPATKTIANVHAGWKGLAGRIIREALRALRTRASVKPENCLIGIGPSIGPCCYTFRDARSALPRHMHAFITEEETLNLWAAAEAQLKESGVQEKNIENLRLCTFDHNGAFYSHRRGDTERFGSAIMLR